MHIEFREINENDLQEVLSIYTYYVENTTFSFHMHSLTAEEIRCLVFFDNPKYKAYVMLDREAICGYMILSQFGVREAYDETGQIAVYLKCGYTGKGIGTRAISFIEQVAVKNKFHVLIATICAENTGSIRLFESVGYEKCAHYKQAGYKFGRRLDVVAYQRILS